VQRDRNQEVISPGSPLRARRAAKGSGASENAPGSGPKSALPSDGEYVPTLDHRTAKTMAAAGCAD